MPAWSFPFPSQHNSRIDRLTSLIVQSREFRADMAHVRSVQVDRLLDFSRRFIGRNATQCRSSSFSFATFQRFPLFISKKKPLPLSRLYLRVIYHLTSSRKSIFLRARVLRSTWLAVGCLKECVGHEILGLSNYKIVAWTICDFFNRNFWKYHRTEQTYTNDEWWETIADISVRTYHARSVDRKLKLRY